MPILLPEELEREFPKLVPIKQIFDKGYIEDIGTEILQQLNKKEIKQCINANQRVAIAVGSRGINRMADIVKTISEELKRWGAQPFVVSAMGSHGGGTEAGQREVLEGYGITEENMGVPVITTTEVVELGRINSGQMVYTDKAAYEADVTIVINRVKPHTDFEGDIESGLCKMCVIGLGNHKGCATIHSAGFEKFSTIIEEAAELVTAKAGVAFGVAIVENAVDKTFKLETVLAKDFARKDKELLELSKKKMPRIRFDAIDILIVEEIGKNISGNGADPNIVGRHGPKANSKDVPAVKQMVVLDLSEETHGNAIGIGMADFTTKKVLRKMDFASTYANCLASRDLLSGRLPFVMEDEREALAAAVKMYSETDLKHCRIVKIKNTLELENIWVSEALLNEAKGKAKLFEIGSIEPKMNTEYKQI